MLHTADASVKLGGKGNGAHVQKDISHLRYLIVTDVLLFVAVRIFLLSEVQVLSTSGCQILHEVLSGFK
jgi:hypothetical protein